MKPQTQSKPFDTLDLLMEPRSVVVVGASDKPGSIGQRSLTNIIEHSKFEGELFLVNATKDEVMGRRCYRRVEDLPYAPDLAVVAVPAHVANEVLESCGKKGIRFAVVLTSGFGEAGEEGKRLEARMRQIPGETGIRIYGPNCPGLTNTNKGLGFTFSPSFEHDRMTGPIGLATQGGGLGRTFLQACERGVGIGLWCSAGNEVDLTVSDYINHMVSMPEIKVIVTLLEGINDPPRFARAALNAAAHGKPIVALKVGKSDYGIKATQSHTAALSGSTEINSTAFRQLGIIEVDDIDELIDTAALLARGVPKRDARVAVYGFSGGTVALAADMLGLAGLTLAQLDPATDKRLRELLPPYAAFDNPVDTTAEILVRPEISFGSLLAVAQDPNVDVVLFPIPMEYGATTRAAAENMVKVQAQIDKPIVPVWISDRVGEGYQVMIEGGLVPVRSVGKAIKALQRWNDFGQRQRELDTNWLPAVSTEKDGAGQGARKVYSETEGKALLASAGVPVPRGRVARNAQEAVDIAAELGGAVVAKIASADILHKSDIGGVMVGLRTEAEVRAAWDSIMASAQKACPEARIDGLLIEQMANLKNGVETLIGVHRDPLFGPILTFGLGGIYVELFKDVSRRLLPITPRDAAEMIRETRCHKLLKGYRGSPATDIAALERLLLAVSDFVTKGGHRVLEMDLNPVVVSPTGAMALDAVLVTAQDA